MAYIISIIWVLVWSIPLMVRRNGLTALLAVLGVCSLIFGSIGLWYYADYLWFSEVQDQGAVYLTKLQSKWELIGFYGLLAAAIAAVSGTLAAFIHERTWLHSVSSAIAWGVVAFVVASAIAMQGWEVRLLAQHFESGGPVDPIFGKELSFYLFELPYQYFEYTMLFVLVGCMAIPAFVAAIPRHSYNSTDILLLATAFAAVLWTIAFGYDTVFRFGLMFDDNGKVHGVDYMAHNVSLSWYPVLSFVLKAAAIVSVLGGLASVFFKGQKDSDAFTLIGGVVSVVAVVATFVTYGGVYIVKDQFTVKPNDLAMNTPYIEHTIIGTRTAYNLTSENIEVVPYDIAVDMSPEDLAANAPTLDNVRIWGYKAWLARVSNAMAFKPYYQFADADLDRYTNSNGDIVPVLLAQRDVTRANLSGSANNWINRKLKYTHGYGVITSPVNEFVGDGEPVYLTRDFNDVTTQPWLHVDEPRIYFGHNYNGHVFVNAGTDEVDRPAKVGEGNEHNQYACDGGYTVNTTLRKLAVLWNTGDHKIFFSEYLKNSPDARILTNRDAGDRIQHLASFLEADDDWYTVIHEGRLYAMQDLYTTSGWYPYAEAFGDSDGSDVNYVRPAAKAVMDLCHGKVSIYAYDDTDPVLATYRSIFPTLFQDKTEMPEGLQSHIRYPEAYFKIQFAAYAEYHVDNLDEFYNGTDVWRVPEESYRNQSVAMEPRYVLTELVGGEGPEFVIMRPFVFEANERRRMTAWMAGRSDGENYGKLFVYRFAKDVHIQGPRQIEQKINAYEPFSEALLNWSRDDSYYFRGNLIVLPLKTNHLVAFEPFYVKADSSAPPVLSRVVSVQQRPGADNALRIAWGSTYEESRAALLGYASSVGLLGDNSEEIGQMTDAELITLVRQHLSSHQQLAGNGQFAAAGTELEKALQALEGHIAEDN